MKILDVGVLTAAVRARAPDAPLDRVEAAMAVGTSWRPAPTS